MGTHETSSDLEDQKRSWINNPWFYTCIVLFLVGLLFYVLIHPQRLPMSFERGPLQSVGSHYLFGPYPTDEEWVALKNAGVTHVISLLDPRLPHEGYLIDQERALTQRLGMGYENIPMLSILNYDPFGENVRKADQVVKMLQEKEGQGKVYIHCYLGRHRVNFVKERLIQKP